MIIAPKMRGFICTTAHPAGCAENVRGQIEYAEKTKLQDGPRRVLVIGSSTGYGLAARIAAAFSCGAATLGAFYEKPAAKGRTATAGWYNNLAFERIAKESGLIAESINGDAFSNAVKQEAITLIKEKLGGKLDLVVYSLAAPKRQDPETGEAYSSVIKPLGKPFTGKTVDFHTGEVSQVTIAPANEEEAAQTVKVMGGEDWLLWMKALNDAEALAENAMTVAFSYIGPELTHAVYKDGTIGKAKEDLEEKSARINELLSPIGGRAFVSVNKALVTQASSAIPVVPLYMSALFKLMKEAGTHEGCIEQMVRMFRERLYAPDRTVPVDEHGRIRLDDLEMEPEIQSAVDALWQRVETANAEELTDLKGYREDFLRLFGFGLENVDYGADIEP
jgi:enoyl-[acyl-carrier protein] reductase/trans-2-enoyl-CoA reductase (NAD+)